MARLEGMVIKTPSGTPGNALKSPATDGVRGTGSSGEIHLQAQLEASQRSIGEMELRLGSTMR